MKIFISYAKEDREIALRLYKDLKSKKIKPWIDSEDLLGGQEWKVAIREEIKTSDYFLALLSNNSISKKGYVQKEIKIALEIREEFPSAEIFIIPILIEECMPTDEILKDLHMVYLFHSYEEGLKKILRSLKLKKGSNESSKLPKKQTKKKDKTVKKQQICQPSSLPNNQHHKLNISPPTTPGSLCLPFNKLPCDHIEDVNKKRVKSYNGLEAAKLLEQSYMIPHNEIVENTSILREIIVDKEIELIKYKSSYEDELSNISDQIRHNYRKGKRTESLKELQSYIDSFQGELNNISPEIKAKFWHTLGMLNWDQQQQNQTSIICLYNIKNINPSFDCRTLEALLLVDEKKYDDALRVLKPINTPKVFTLALSILLDNYNVQEFDLIWKSSKIETIDIAYQLLAYRCRLDREFKKANEAINKAIELSPEIPSFYISAGNITFWEAVPEFIDTTPRSINLVTLPTQFYCPNREQLCLLDKAIGFYEKAISLIEYNTNEKDQVTEIKTYKQICLTYHTKRQDEAKSLALILLDDNPANFPALFYCLEMDVQFNINQSIEYIELKRKEGSFSESDIFSLAKIYVKGDAKKAINIIENDKNIFKNKNWEDNKTWVVLMLNLLIKDGDPEKAFKIIENCYFNNNIKKSLKAQLYGLLGEYEKLEELAIQLNSESESISNLINICAFYWKTMQWKKLEPYANRLLCQYPNLQSVYFVAYALYHNNKFRECSELIEKYEIELNYDNEKWYEITQINISCLLKLNQFDTATKSLEKLYQENPNRNITQNLAYAYFSMGKKEKVVDLLKDANKSPWEDSSLMVSLSQLMLKERPEEAFNVAKEAKQKYTEDPDVRIHYIQTAFNTGHDNEAAEALHKFQNKFPDAPHLIPYSLNELIEESKNQKEHIDKVNNLFKNVQIPLHCILDFAHETLGLNWYIKFKKNRSTNDWKNKSPLFIQYGSNSPKREKNNQVNRNEIIMDYTSILMVKELDILEFVENSFSKIIIPPSLLIHIQKEIDKTVRFQPSVLQRLKSIKQAVDNTKITVLADIIINKNILKKYQINKIGFEKAIIFYLAAQKKGNVLAQYISEEENGKSILKNSLREKRIFPKEIISALYYMGVIRLHEMEKAILSCQNEQCRDNIVKNLSKRSLLITDSLTLEFFEDFNILDRLIETFDVCITETERKKINSEFDGYQLRKETSRWLDNIRHNISDKLYKNYFFPEIPILKEDEKANIENLELLLYECFKVIQDKEIPLCIDDRCIQQFGSSKNLNILGIEDLLIIIKEKKLISEEQYFDSLLKMMELNVKFLPIYSDMVKYYICNATLLESGKINETYELKTIRKYYLSNFQQTAGLRTTLSNNEIQSEAEQYFIQYMSSCRILINKIWTDTKLTQKNKKAATNWVLSRLWRNSTDIQCLFPKQLKTFKLFAITHSMLISEAFLMTFDDNDYKNVIAYIKYIYYHFLETCWKVNPKIKSKFIEHMKIFIIKMIDEQDSDIKRLLLKTFAYLFSNSPPEIGELLFSDKEIVMIFEDYITKGGHVVGELHFTEDKWQESCIKSINNNKDKTITDKLDNHQVALKWFEISPFILGLNIDYTNKDGELNHYSILDPFVKLSHNLNPVRQEFFQNILPYLDISVENATKIKSNLSKQQNCKKILKQIANLSENSWGYFWGRLQDYCEQGLGLTEDVIFPKNPAMFINYLALKQDAYKNEDIFNKEWTSFFHSRINEYGFENELKLLMAFPFGNPSPLHIINKHVDSKNINVNDVINQLNNILTKTTNPVIFQNSLDILLNMQNIKFNNRDHIKSILQKLLNPISLVDNQILSINYRLYITSLKFAWIKMEGFGYFDNQSVNERILWCYAYSHKLIEIVDNLIDKKYSYNLKPIIEWMENRINSNKVIPFEKSSDQFQDVIHPMNASLIRTIISPTLRIVNKQEQTLPWLLKEIVKYTENLSAAIFNGKIRDIDIVKPFNSIENYFNSTYDKNVFSNIQCIFNKFDKEITDSIKIPSDDFISFIKEFDSGRFLSEGFKLIKENKSWTHNDITIIYSAIERPLSPTITSIVLEIIPYIDLTCFKNINEFMLAGLTLIRLVNFTNNKNIFNLVLDKLGNILSKSGANKQYCFIVLQCIAKVFDNKKKPYLEFYEWLDRAVETLKIQVLENIYDTLDWLTWQIPLKKQTGLPQVKLKLLSLL